MAAAEEVNIVALVKDESHPVERYLFFFTDANRDAAVNAMGRFAADPQLSFTFSDAAMLSAKARRVKGCK